MGSKPGRTLLLQHPAAQRSVGKAKFKGVFSQCVSQRKSLTKENVCGRRAIGFIIQAVDGCVSLGLPTSLARFPIIERKFTATHQPHLKAAAAKVRPLDPAAEILSLLVRDIICVHEVHSRYYGPRHAQYAQCLDF